MKKYLVSLENIEYDEFEVKAKNKKDAHRKAQKIVDEEYSDMDISDIEEIKNEKT